MKKSSLLLLVIFLSFAGFAGTRQQIVLTVQDVNTGLFDQTIAYFDSGLVNKFTTPQDVQKNLDSSGTATLPLIYSFSTDGVPCSLNGYGNFSGSVQLDLGVYLKPNATYVISSVQIANFDPTAMIRLEDRAQDVFTDLREGGYTFQAGAGGEIDSRFVIHFSYQPKLSTTLAGCNNEDGLISVAEDTSLTWDNCNLLDSNMVQVAQVKNVTGNFSFANLPAGTYTLQFLLGSDVPSKTVVVAGDKISPVIQPSLTIAPAGQKITFNTQAANATIYQWNFGDGSTLSNVADPQYAYAQPGTYTVTLQCNNNNGCIAYTFTEVTIEQAAGISQLSADAVKVTGNGRQVEIKLEGNYQNNYTYELYDISGRMLQTAPVTSSDFTVTLATYSPGIYVFNVKDAASHFAQKILVTE